MKSTRRDFLKGALGAGAAAAAAAALGPLEKWVQPVKAAPLSPDNARPVPDKIPNVEVADYVFEEGFHPYLYQSAIGSDNPYLHTSQNAGDFAERHRRYLAGRYDKRGRLRVGP